MLDFSSFDNTSGAFPDVTATNSSGPTLRDGTPITANVLNDVWGAFQAVLNAAGTTPSAAVETSSASDFLDSVRKLGGAPGEIVLYATPSDVIDANILPLKGQVLTIAAYPALVAATYIGDGNNAITQLPGFYKSGDSLGISRNTAGAYFQLPDCRGYFLRALAGAATGRDAGRDYDTADTGVDHGNMSGKLYAESPGQHRHDIFSSFSRGLDEDQQWVFRGASSPGPLGGVDPTQTYMYRGVITSPASQDLLTIRGKSYDGATDYGTDFNDEVRPAHVAFQLGIRY